MSDFDWQRPCFDCSFRDRCDSQIEDFQRLFDSLSYEKQELLNGLIDDFDLVLSGQNCVSRRKAPERIFKFSEQWEQLSIPF